MTSIPCFFLTSHPSSFSANSSAGPSLPGPAECLPTPVIIVNVLGTLLPERRLILRRKRHVVSNVPARMEDHQLLTCSLDTMTPSSTVKPWTSIVVPPNLGVHLLVLEIG